MTAIEMSNEFDVIYSNITSNQAPGIDEYEKSVFLTKAQDEIVKAYFNPRANKTGEGFDDSLIRQADFSSLIRQSSGDTDPVFDDGIHSAICQIVPGEAYPGMAYSRIYLPEYLAILNESVICLVNSKAQNKTAIPISFEEFNRLMKKPYKRPTKNCVWRLDVSEAVGKMVLLIGAPTDEFSRYAVRYVGRPKPIVTADLDNGVTVDGISDITDCELDGILHHEIVQRAAELAKAAYVGDLSSTVQLGTASQTGIGYVPSGR